MNDFLCVLPFGLHFCSEIKVSSSSDIISGTLSVPTTGEIGRRRQDQNKTTVLAHAATDDAAVGSEMTCRNNAVSAQEASESAARLTDDSASSEEDLGEALRAA